jgi:hypothetical protein
MAVMNLYQQGEIMKKRVTIVDVKGVLEALPAKIDQPAIFVGQFFTFMFQDPSMDFPGIDPINPLGITKNLQTMRSCERVALHVDNFPFDTVFSSVKITAEGFKGGKKEKNVIFIFQGNSLVNMI